MSAIQDLEGNWVDSITGNPVVGPSDSGNGTSSTGSSLGSWLTGLTQAVTTGNTLYNTVQRDINGQANPVSATTTKTTATLISSLPWIIGGGVLLVLAFLFLGRRK